MKIRKEQMLVFEQATKQNFEDEMVVYLDEFAPKHCEIVGEAQVRTIIRYGVEKAESYGFTTRATVKFYLELMFMLGGHFDTDPQYAQIGAILEEQDEQSDRAGKIYKIIMAYLDTVAGKEKEYALEAFRKMSKINGDTEIDWTQNIDYQIKNWLMRIYPQKSDWLGEEKIRRVIEEGKETAQKYDVTAKRGKALFVALNFALGHGFADDPLLPWISATLRDERFDDPNVRAENLERRVKIYLDRAVRYLDGRK